MFDDSGMSLSASDPNPSIDQFNDDGSGADFSTVVNTVGQWGTEIASLVTGRPVVYAAGAGGPIPIGAPGSYVGNSPPMAQGTKLLMVLLGVGVAVVALHLAGSRL